jgi:hypothetical protein
VGFVNKSTKCVTRTGFSRPPSGNTRWHAGQSSDDDPLKGRLGGQLLWIKDPARLGHRTSLPPVLSEPRGKRRLQSADKEGAAMMGVMGLFALKRGAG